MFFRHRARRADNTVGFRVVAVREEAELAGGRFVEKTFSDEEGSIGYLLYVPKAATANMPLVVYLHGGSGRGDDLSLLTERHGLPQYLHRGEVDAGAYVFMPQAGRAVRDWSPLHGILSKAIRSIVAEYGIDKANVSLTGHSMGGEGTWTLAAENPGLFVRIAPLNGSPRPVMRMAERFGGMGVWSFAGSGRSDGSALSGNEEFFTSLRRVVPDARLTVVDGAEHSDIDRAYKDYDILGWLTGRSGMADGAKRLQSASTTATLLDRRIVRLSRVTVDPARLTEYVAFATECGRASMARESGVIFMYSMSDKKTPNIVTILEIYADEAAYRSHIATEHFRKYKQGTLDMVQKLELLDQTALIPDMTMKETER